LLRLKNLPHINLATIENEAHEEDKCAYLALSALPPKADMCGALADVRFGPKADIRVYSITSSARVSRVGGTLSSSALAVLRLITSSNFVGSCTGRSAGFSPLRMRSA